MTRKALVEIAKAFAGVNMHTMPAVPADAPCRLPGSDPEDWFDPFRNADLIGVPLTYADQIAEDLCAGCPVLGQCLVWGLANPRQEGILGGTTHRRRLALIKEQRRRPHRRPAA